MGAEFSDQPEAERVRRERLRDIGSGVSSYSVSENADTAAIVVGGRLILLDLQTALWTILGDSGVTHPLTSPDGTRVAYAREGAVFVANVAARSSKRITPDDAPASWGIPEFVAAEEILRFDAMWWTAKSDHLLITRVDNSDLSEMWIGNLEDQSVKPKSVRLPLAGNQNSRVRLYMYGINSGALRQIEGWDMDLFPYLVRVSVQDDALTALVQSRDQKQYELLRIGTSSRTVTCVERGRLEPWVPIHCGLPTVDHEGVVIVEHIGTSRVAKLPNQKTSDTSMNVDAFVSSGEVRLIATYSIEKYRRSVVAWDSRSESQRVSIGHVSNLSMRGGTVVIVEENLDSVRPKTRVLTRRADLSWREVGCIQSYADDPDMSLNVAIWRLCCSYRRITTARKTFLFSSIPMGPANPQSSGIEEATHCFPVVRQSWVCCARS
jgi:dipeptidyl-peptidase-4